MKAGLEVHQQLATGKLFCGCPSELSETVTAEFSRRLRATSGENLQIDRAALVQSARGRTFDYEATPTSCLVELDEEPPHPLNPDALDVALTMAILLGARPLDEVEVMRKIVVDGSNTAGFQRTALVAVDGHLEVGGRTYTIPTICLEEDAARKVSESHGRTRYRLDRLGVPLIEIATGPEITDGTEAREVAEEIGALLRSTGKVRRGIGTIREDLNVSAEGGARIEIKGVQELRKIHRFVEIETGRQAALLAVTDDLRRRGATVPDVPPVDVSSLLRGRSGGPVAQILEHGGVVLAIGLPGFAGRLRPEGDPPERLGRELADQARAFGLRGLLHSDELATSGIDPSAVGALRAAIGVPNEADAFVLVAAESATGAARVLEEVQRRARAALEGIPPETRDPMADGRTRYSRPLPGRDRMYPETDVPPVLVTAERIERLTRTLPERPDAVRSRLESTFGLSEETARSIYRSGEVERLEELARRGRDPSAIARLLVRDLPSLEGSDGWDSDRLSLDALDALLVAVAAGEFGKEGIPRVLLELSKGAATLSEAARAAGLSEIGTTDLDELAARIVERNIALVRSRGDAAFQPLMGDLMKEVRGRRDGSEIARALRSALAKARSAGPA